MFELTLTFDNGPTPRVTDAVLDVLASYQIRATFFVLGEKLSEPAGRRVAGRAHEEGHWIGNHTWSHPAPFGQWADRQDPTSEIVRTQDLMGSLAHPDRFFRPPGGGGYLDRRLLSAKALRCIRSQGMTLVLWNAIPRDWEDPDNWPAAGLEQCRRNERSLMVLHDTDTGAMRNLPRFIGSVLDAGGRFRQRFPPDCVPILRGELTGPIDRYVTLERGKEHIQ